MAAKVADYASAIVVAVLLLTVIGGFGYVTWYQAGIQAAVYERQGVHMTQWEVWVGAKPAERTVHIRETK